MKKWLWIQKVHNGSSSFFSFFHMIFNFFIAVSLTHSIYIPTHPTASYQQLIFIFYYLISLFLFLYSFLSIDNYIYLSIIHISYNSWQLMAWSCDIDILTYFLSVYRSFNLQIILFLFYSGKHLHTSSHMIFICKTLSVIVIIHSF
jgi:hypothetical protein